MNAVWAHLLFNHIAIIGCAIGLLAALVGMVMKSTTIKHVGMVIFLVTGLTVYVTNLTGEPAEEAIEHMPGISKDMIHDHEEASEWALNLTSVALALCAVSLFYRPNNKSFRNIIFTAWVVVSAFGIAALIKTGHDGGMIRRPDLQEQLHQ